MPLYKTTTPLYMATLPLYKATIPLYVANTLITRQPCCSTRPPCRSTWANMANMANMPLYKATIILQLQLYHATRLLSHSTWLLCSFTSLRATPHGNHVTLQSYPYHSTSLGGHSKLTVVALLCKAPQQGLVRTGGAVSGSYPGLCHLLPQDHVQELHGHGRVLTAHAGKRIPGHDLQRRAVLRTDAVAGPGLQEEALRVQKGAAHTHPHPLRRDGAVGPREGQLHAPVLHVMQLVDVVACGRHSAERSGARWGVGRRQLSPDGEAHEPDESAAHVPAAARAQVLPPTNSHFSLKLMFFT